MYLSELWEYPVKSCQSRQLQLAEVTQEGFKNDRRYLFVTPQGRFVTQREFPQLVKVSAYHDNDNLVFDIGGQQQHIPKSSFQENLSVTIWKDRVEARVSQYSPTLVADFLDIPLLLVELPFSNRPISDQSAEGYVSFADGLPFLLATTASLAELNERLTTPVKMLNFRPNLVISTAVAFAEDEWSRLRIGEVVFRAVKPCSRCIMTTVNTDTGRTDESMEPLKTLATYRTIPGKGVMFGVNLIAENNGWVHIKDPVEILS